jgi:hypothetical protein
VLHFKQGTRPCLTRTMKRSTPFSRVFTGVANALKIPPRVSPTFTFDGKSLERRQTPSELNMKDGDIINVTPESPTSGVKHPHRKPVIYLFSPTDIDATVTLTLDNEWSLSAIYPVVPIKFLDDGQHDQVQWSVRTHKDGSLTTHDTSLDVSYLFWEAEYVFYTRSSGPQLTVYLSSSTGPNRGLPNLFPNHLLLPHLCQSILVL